MTEETAKEKAMSFIKEQDKRCLGITRKDIITALDIALIEQQKQHKEEKRGMICSDCGKFNCDCGWFVLNRLNIKLKKENQKLKEKIKELTK